MKSATAKHSIILYYRMRRAYLAIASRSSAGGLATPPPPRPRLAIQPPHPRPLSILFPHCFGVLCFCAQASRGFVSKWAEKLLQTSKRWFSAPDQPSPAAPAAPAASAAASPAPPPGGAGSGLIDASAASRSAALGQGEVGSEGFAKGGGVSGWGKGGEGAAIVDSTDRAHDYDAASVVALSELLAVLLRRWGTGANASNQVMQVSFFCVCFCVYSCLFVIRGAGGRGKRGRHECVLGCW